MSALRLAALSFGLTLPVWSALSGCSQSDPAGSGPPSKAGAGGQSSAGAANSGGGSSGARPAEPRGRPAAELVAPMAEAHRLAEPATAEPAEGSTRLVQRESRAA